MHRCPECNTPFPEGTRFCTGCGLNLEEAIIYHPVCPNCGAKYAAGTRFCLNDGTPLVEDPNPTPAVETPPSNFRSPEELIDYGYEVRIGDYVNRGWEIFKRYPGEFIGYTVLYLLIIGVASNVPFGGIIEGPLTAGFYIVAIYVIRGKSFEFKEFFNGFNYILPLILASLVTSLLTILGCLLLIIPGIYLAVAYTFTYLLIIDRKMEFWAAMEATRKVVTRNWFPMFGFVLVLMLINLAGLVAFCLGLIVTIPLTACATVAAYEDIFGIRESEFKGL